MSPGKDGGMIKSCVTEGQGYQTPNDYAAVSSKNFLLSFKDHAYHHASYAM